VSATVVLHLIRKDADAGENSARISARLLYLQQQRHFKTQKQYRNQGSQAYAHVAHAAAAQRLSQNLLKNAADAGHLHTNGVNQYGKAVVMLGVEARTRRVGID